MNTGTAIFAIVFILICSFIGLGIMVKQTEFLEVENRSLKERVSSLEAKLGETQKELTDTQSKNADLASTVEGLHSQILEEQKSKEAAKVAAAACAAAKGNSGLPLTTVLGMMIVPILATSAKVIYDYKGFHPVGSYSLVSARVPMYMTRDQISRIARLLRKAE